MSYSNLHVKQNTRFGKGTMRQMSKVRLGYATSVHAAQAGFPNNNPSTTVMSGATVIQTFCLEQQSDTFTKHSSSTN